MKTYPILIIGMHRSGTSILTDALEKAGLFLGAQKEQNLEAVLFLRLNKWMFMNAHASWDNPYNLKFMNDFFIQHQVRVCGQHLHGFPALKYLGWKNFLKYRDVRKLDFPFGWKDPRNTFTVPVWKNIFPSLRLIHIYRHPADVIASLQSREKIIRTGPKNKSLRRKKERKLDKRVNYTGSLRIYNFSEGFDIWKTYTQKAFSYTEESGEGIMHIRYEDLIENPLDCLPEILEFSGLKFDMNFLKSISSKFDKSRIFPFRNNPQMLEFFQAFKNDELVQQLNYNEI